jgi:hypothetical protein
LPTQFLNQLLNQHKARLSVAADGALGLRLAVVDDLIEAITGCCIAAGDDLIVCRRNSERGRAARFLAERGHVKINWDLVRPVGVREGGLFG